MKKPWNEPINYHDYLAKRSLTPEDMQWLDDASLGELIDLFQSFSRAERSNATYRTYIHVYSCIHL